MEYKCKSFSLLPFKKFQAVLGMMDVATLLPALFDSQAAPASKEAALRDLNNLKCSIDGLVWAMHVLSTHSPVGNESVLWFAADVACFWAKYRAGTDRLSELKGTLWGCLYRKQSPRFVNAKLAVALASTACHAWPSAYPNFWSDLQHLVSKDRSSGIQVISALIEEFQGAAQATSASLKGVALSSSIPGIQTRYREVLPAAIDLLCSILQDCRGRLSGAHRHAQHAELAVTAVHALHTLHKALTELSLPPPAPSQPEPQHPLTGRLPEVLDLLLSFALAPDWTPPPEEGTPSLQELSAAAMDCVGELLLKRWPQQAEEALLEKLVVQILPGCAGCLQRHWERCSGAGALVVAGEEPALAAYVRLVSLFMSRSLARVEGSQALHSQALSLLHGIAGMMLARRIPGDVAAFCEVWHAVLDHKDSQELEGGWTEEGSPTLQAAAADPYKDTLLQVSQVLLATLLSLECSPQGRAAPPPFTLGELEGEEGSGAALEEWVQVVSSGAGGEGEEGGGGADGDADGEGEDEEGEVLVPGSRSIALSPQRGQSQQEVYARVVEGLVSRVGVLYCAQTHPTLLACFGRASAVFALRCGALCSVQRAQQLPEVAAALCASCRDMDILLRMLARSGPGLPLRGLEQQATLAELAAPGGRGAPLAVSGAHAAAAYRTLLELSLGWYQTLQATVSGPLSTHLDVRTLQPLGALGARIYRTLGALTATWLSRLMLTQLATPAGVDADLARLISHLAQSALSAPAQLLCALGPGACQLGGALGQVLSAPAVAAAEALPPLTSIALASAMKPPADLLLGLLSATACQDLRRAAREGVAPTHLPTSALRALWTSLSDLHLRSWSHLPAASFPSDARAAQFAQLCAPLVACFAEVEHGTRSTHGVGAAAQHALRRAAAVVGALVSSFAGTPKHVRGLVYRHLASPLLPPALSLLRHLAAPAHSQQGCSRASMALLRMLRSVIDVLGLELGAGGLEQLLGGLVEALGQAGGDPSLESDLALMQLLCNVLGQGGGKHQSLLLPSLRFCFGVWQKAGRGGGGEVDEGHVKAVTLASLLTLLRHRWRQLSGAHAAPAASAEHGGVGSMGGGGALSSLHGELLGGGRQAGEGGGGAGTGVEAICQTLSMLQAYVAAAAAGGVVLAAADVRLVLEELFELQVLTKLYQSPYFQPVREPLLAGLLSMLLGRLYTSAQHDLVDTIFSIAASNWSEFHLSFLPRFVDHQLQGLGPSEKQSLVGLFGVQDLDAPSFERQVLSFMNDALFYQRAHGVAV